MVHLQKYEIVHNMDIIWLNNNKLACGAINKMINNPKAPSRIVIPDCCKDLDQDTELCRQGSEADFLPGVFLLS